MYGDAARLHTSFLSLFSAIAGEIDVVAVEDPVLVVHLAL